MMKQLFVIFIASIFAISFSACSKSEVGEESLINAKVFGKWKEYQVGFEKTVLVRVSRFGEYERGIVIFEDNTMIERSEGGICIGEFCLMDNYYGTYESMAKDQIKVKVSNYSGPQNYRLQFISVKTDTIVIQKTL